MFKLSAGQWQMLFAMYLLAAEHTMDKLMDMSCRWKLKRLLVLDRLLLCTFRRALDAPSVPSRPNFVRQARLVMRKVLSLTPNKHRHAILHLT